MVEDRRLSERLSAVGSAIAVLVALLGATACTGTSSGVNPSKPTGSGAECVSASKVGETSNGLEVVGASVDGTTLYGLVQAEPYPLVASTDIKKFVWRIGGSGDLTVTVSKPDGTTTSLAWGPEYHSSSNYDRPGDEYGTGVVADQSGCWHLSFHRSGTGKADIWLDVGRGAV